MTTEQLIEEAVERFRDRFVTNEWTKTVLKGDKKGEYLREVDGEVRRINYLPEEIESFLKEELSTIATKSAEEERQHWLNQSANEHDKQIRADERKIVIEEAETKFWGVASKHLNLHEKDFREGLSTAVENMGKEFLNVLNKPKEL